MDNNINIFIGEGGDRDLANCFSEKNKIPIYNELSDGLNIVFDNEGIGLTGYGLSYRGDFEESMLRRITGGRYKHEMLVKASKCNKDNPTAIDATAGMGEDSLLLAANGYDISLYEQNPVVALLLKDALKRAKKNPELKDLISRMHLIEGDSLILMKESNINPDIIYLDPMFPGRQKSGLIGKKLQLIQKLESPCSNEKDLFDAAKSCKPSKIIVKRPLKAPNLAEQKPNYSLTGKAIRYDIYI